MTALAILTFGWTAAILGFVLLVAGILTRSPSIAIIGAIAAVGFCLYLALNPLPLRLVGILALICNAASAAAVVRKAPRLVSLALLLPFTGAAGFLAYAIRSAR